MSTRLKSTFLICISILLSTYTINAQNIDIDLLKNINPKNPNSFTWRASESSAYPISIGIPFAVFAFGELTHNKKEIFNAYELAGSVATAAIVTKSLKIIFNRERPYEKYPDVIFPYSSKDKGQSFPSAHTSLAFSTATSLSIEYKKWYVVLPAYAWATFVGYSRLYLGEHYPSDVLAGALVGAGSAVLSDWLRKKIFINK